MKIFAFGRLASFACAAAIAWSACGGTATGPVVGNVPPQARQAIKPPCGFGSVHVWVSQLSASEIEGYTTAGVACAGSIITGSSGTACGGTTVPFAAPFGLATDFTGHVYVADVNNKRVVIFNEATGACVNILNTALEPRGVCVSRTGIVGVVERGVGGTGAGDVEFWSSYASTGASTGQGTLLSDWFQWCAFDRYGNFEATGTMEPTGVQQIFYLAAASVNAGAVTLSNSGIATGPYWVGMFVQLPCANTNGKVLAVLNTFDQIVYFKINPVTGAPGPAALSTLSLTGYPSSGSVDQVAPDHCSTKANLYFPDYNDSEVWKAREYNGVITLFNNSASGAVGVATRPSGQE